MKMLLTAYEPFDNRNTNASYEIVKTFPCQLDDILIEKTTLPVIYDYSVYEQLFEQYDVDVLILCGEAAKREKISLEVVSINCMYAFIPDNQGVMMTGQKVLLSGPDAYFSNLDLFKIEALIQNDQLNLSFSAGTYICNFGYYASLSLIEKSNRNTLCCFVHFPLLKETEPEGKITMDEGVEMLEAIIKAIYLQITMK